METAKSLRGTGQMPAKWEEDYRNHDAWTVAEQIRDLLEQHIGDSDEEKATLIELRSFNRAVLSLAEQPSIFVSVRALNELRNALQNHVLQNLQYWVSGSGSAYLDSAHSGAEEVRVALRGWPIATGTSLFSAAAAVRESAKASQQSVSDMSRTIQRLEDELVEATQEVTNNLDEQQKANKLMLDQSLTAIRSEINALEGSVSEVESRIVKTDLEVTRLERQISTTIDGWQSQFTTAETTRSETHNDLVKEHRDELQTAIGEATTAMARYRKDQEWQFERAKDKVDKLRKDIEKVVGAVGIQATATWYEDHANKQRAAADSLRTLAIVLFGAAFIVIAITVFVMGHEEDSWKTTLLKSTATATLVAGAIYATNESSKHRNEEFKNRKVELTLRALDPFIATLDDEPKKRLKVEATRQVFSLYGINPALVGEDDNGEEETEQIPFLN